MKITKEEFNTIFADVLSGEMIRQAITGDMAKVDFVSEIGIAIHIKLITRLFDEDNEIEIVKE